MADFETKTFDDLAKRVIGTLNLIKPIIDDTYMPEKDTMTGKSSFTITIPYWIIHHKDYDKKEKKRKTIKCEMKSLKGTMGFTFEGKTYKSASLLVYLKKNPHDKSATSFNETVKLELVIENIYGRIKYNYIGTTDDEEIKDIVDYLCISRDIKYDANCE